MLNQYNAVNINYFSGGSLVKEIELCYKKADSNEIYLIQKINKQLLNNNINNTTNNIINNNNKNISLHLIGGLQSNKAKDAFKIFNYIHSLDSEKLARIFSDLEKNNENF